MFKPRNLTKTAMKGAVGVGSDGAAASTTTKKRTSLGSTSAATSFSSQTDGRESKSSLVEVEANKKREEYCEQPARPVAFSSQVLRPTVVSPYSQQCEDVQPVSMETTSTFKLQSPGMQDLLS